MKHSRRQHWQGESNMLTNCGGLLKMTDWAFTLLLAASIGVLIRLVDGQHVSVMYGPCDAGKRCTGRQGDIVLGGIFPVHGFDSRTHRCTGSADFEGIQWVEAFRHAVQVVNSDPRLLNGVTLGYEARDTCSEKSVAVQQSLDFIRGIDMDGDECGPIGQNTNSGDSGSVILNSSSVASQTTGTSPKSRIPLVGVVGGYSSSNSIASSDLLGLFSIPMVSYGATNTRLSDTKRFNFFFRVLPSDRFTSVAIAGMAEKFGWRFVSIVYTDDAFGTGGAAAVRTELEAMSPRVCVAAYEQLPLHATLEQGEKNVDAYERVLSKLLQGDFSKARVVVLFLQPKNAKFLLQRASQKRRFLQENFTFVGVDAWGDILSSVQAGQKVAKGSVSAIPFSKKLSIFDKFLSKVRPHVNHPWLCELWIKLFNERCYCDVQQGNCTSSLNSLTSERSGYRQSSKLAFVYDSVFAFAHALTNIKTLYCPEKGVVCKQMLNGRVLRDFLCNVSFSGFNKENSNDMFQFDANGDPLSARYSIKNMVVSASNSRIDFPVRGVFSAIRNTSNAACRTAANAPDSCYLHKLSISADPVWNDGTHSTPISRCSKDCDPGQYAALRGSTACCWECHQCTGFRYTQSQDHSCEECPANSKPSANRSSCTLLNHKQWDAREPLGIVIAILVTLLLGLCVFALSQLFVNWKKVFVMGIELTFLSLLGVIISCIGLAVVFDGPTSLACGAYEVLLSAGLALLSFPIALHSLYRFSSFLKKNIVAEFLSNGRHCLGVALVHEIVPLLMLIIGYSQAQPGTEEIIKRHRSRTIVCSLTQSFAASVSYSLIIALLGVVLCLLTIRWAGREKLGDVVYRSLLSTAMCGIMILTIVLSSFIVHSTLDDTTAKVSIEHLAILMCLSAVLFLLLVIFLRKFPDEFSLPQTTEKVDSLSTKGPEYSPPYGSSHYKSIVTIEPADNDLSKEDDQVNECKL